MLTYILNPDFRRVAPFDGRYCACCQKPIKDNADAVAVTVNWENWEIAEGHGVKLSRRLSSGQVIDPAWVGRACWRKIKKRPWPPNSDHNPYFL